MLLPNGFDVCLSLAFDVVADDLGQGSTQATTEPESLGNDQKFWDSLNANVKNLHAVISGHGASSTASWTLLGTYRPYRSRYGVVRARADEERLVLFRQTFWVSLLSFLFLVRSLDVLDAGTEGTQVMGGAMGCGTSSSVRRVQMMGR